MSQMQSESRYFSSPDLINQFIPEQGYLIEQISEALKVVSQVISPVSPLKDYVAVNPYHGISERSFLNARNYLRIFSDCENLMPLEHYAEEFRSGQFGVKQIQSAVEELESTNLSTHPIPSAEEIVELLHSLEKPVSHTDQMKQKQDRPVRTLSEMLDHQTQGNWSEKICDEISKYCAMHYDQGEAVWGSPWKEMTLYQSWRSAAVHDRNMEFHGLTGFCSYVSELPHTAEASMIASLQCLHVPPALWETYLLCQAFSIPGWSAWVKYQSEESETEDPLCNDLAGLMAMRLAYDAALSKSQAFEVDWRDFASHQPISFKLSADAQDNEFLRYTLLRASEIAFRDRLLNCVAIPSASSDITQHSEQATHFSTVPAERKLAQMVFCIDVRSERIRRQLESVSSHIETFGFAGFFGLPIEFVRLGDQSGDSQVPVLLKPQIQIYEDVQSADPDLKSHLVKQRGLSRSLRKLWKNLRTSAVGCFPFVETTGLLYGLKLWQRSVGSTSKPSDADPQRLFRENFEVLEPSLNGLNQQGITITELTDLAESMLKNLGLTENFSRLVVFCGHGSQTENNPLKAGLDCGACGGHSGEPNARIAAKILNQTVVRRALEHRGITIPSDTWFVAGLHNTTTDSLDYFECDQVPETHHKDLETLIEISQFASENSRVERMPEINAPTMTDLMRRAADWSEVRPEWGLAGNAAFVIAPREFTREINLDARTFLHSYDHENDQEGIVLENIMTAPMIVAHWINMQYYASTVDNHHFGSGNKTLHNVVGGFGILSGNGGDLMTGLPWQSLNTGAKFQHQPLRLQVLIAAPRNVIEKIIAKHQDISNLLTGGWMHLISLEEQQQFQYSTDGNWNKIELTQS
ncbi:hypothetical protein Pan241w_37150 [Gimesia alba]|uniref:Probable inorganic carbon transporter subunit DabA n=1 Tax=Gimesia alba TaxID=2527973 RepID=A0A517RID3_9PLAN|nr:DUF2309 domain-containing protein [Gimesia alba]QDT43613.1 hypothetical protein Pan241w_37150 [Gimesia alba]